MRYGFNIIMVNPYALKEAVEEAGGHVEFIRTRDGGHYVKVDVGGAKFTFPYIGDEWLEKWETEE